MGGMVWSARELWDGVVTLIDVRDDLSVSICMLGLTMVGVVVVEMEGQIPPLGQIWWRAQWGEWYGVPGSCTTVM
jgi:hypothetical protein